MKIFKDALGTEWTIDLKFGTVKRVKEVAELDLLDLDEGRLLEKLLDDAFTFVNALYVACKPQADERGITDEQFGGRLSGDTIELARKAFMEELIAFFPSRKRKILAEALATAEKIQAKIADQAIARLNDPAMMGKIEAALLSGPSPGDAPQSSAATSTD
jgi:hypothetical protein